MSAKPTVLLAPHFRKLSEIFSPEDLERLQGFGNIVWNKDEPLPAEELESCLPDIWAYIGTGHQLDKNRLDQALNLKAIVEVGGAFVPGIDYEACFTRGIRVLSCAPAFGPQVAEMTLTMMLAGARGLVAEHEAFRTGEEEWQGDRPEWDFSLRGQPVGFVGFGSLARNLLPLLKPFDCHIRAYDPWLPKTHIQKLGCEPANLDEVLKKSRVVVVLAVPTPENRGFLNKERLAHLQKNALLVLISRSHLVDFEALTEALYRGDFQAAIDVFPEEPLSRDHPIRNAPNVILSAHRAASIWKERQVIGRMVVDDLELMARGLPPTQLQGAEPELIRKLLRV